MLLLLAGLVGALLAAGLSARALAADSYTLDWWTIDSGGSALSEGTSTGGDVYTLSGTSGQPDAQATPMAGGVYSVTGGYWQKNMSEWRLFLPLVRD
jgi:hypothetical protein